MRCFQEAVRLSPDHLIALNNLGNAYRLQKNWDEARKVFERALEVSPNDPEANYGLGMVFAQADDTAHAYEYLQRALKSRPAYPEALTISEYFICERSGEMKRSRVLKSAFELLLPSINLI